MKKVKNNAPISPVMQGLATYIAGALRKPLPEPVLEKTKHHVLDTIAAMVSGSRLLPGRMAMSYIKTRGGTPEACVAGSRNITTAENAALANAMMAHADETDDSHAATAQHPGCGIVSAALAMAERERRGGTALLRAVALGYDVSCRINRALHAQEFRVVHATHSFGPMFGAASAAGALAGLGYNQVRHLLSYTAQQVSGLGCWQRDTEHIEKAFVFGGMAARNGVTAACMVAHGCTAVEDVFSGERSFFVAYDESGRIGKPPEAGRLINELGSTYEIMGTTIKRWTVGSPIQAPLDSLLELINAHQIKPEDVERVVVRIQHSSLNTVSNSKMPDVCLQHMCAVMLLDGIVTFESAHDTKRMKDKRVLAMRRRIELYGHDAFPDTSRQAIVEIRLRDGREFDHYTSTVRGRTDNPMTRAEVDQKAFHLMAPTLGTKRARALCDAIWNLERVSNLRSLRPLLRA